MVRLSLLIFAALAFLECLHAGSVWAERGDNRDFAVDQALGELDAGTRLLSPDVSGKAGQATTAGPGRTVSPGDAGSVRGARGAGTPSLGGARTERLGGPGVSGSGAASPGTGGGVGTDSVGGGGEPVVDVDVGMTDTQAEIDTDRIGTDTSGSAGIDVDVDVDTTTGEVSGDVSVGGEPVIETDVDTGADLGGATSGAEDLTGDAGLDVGLETDTTTVDGSATTTEDNLTIDVSAGSDTLGDSLTGTGGELDPDSDSTEEDTGADNDDCNVLDPLSIPERCL
jgi:hypothetical protein